jgi:Spy/CpxP family protein refolding chaperone
MKKKIIAAVVAAAALGGAAAIPAGTAHALPSSCIQLERAFLATESQIGSVQENPNLTDAQRAQLLRALDARLSQINAAVAAGHCG